MEDTLALKGAIGMARGTLARVEEGSGLWIHVWDGTLWVTREGDRRDYLVQPGESFALECDGVALIHALRRAVVTMTAPAHADFAKRITVTPPGTVAPRLLYERPRERAGRLAGLRHRLARLRADFHIRYLKPTTAAL